MSGIDNPLKKLTRVPREQYHEILRRQIFDIDDTDAAFITLQLTDIREKIAAAYVTAKDRLMLGNGKSSFEYSLPYPGWHHYSEDGRRRWKKLHEQLTAELKETLGATEITEYDGSAIVYRIPLVEEENKK